MGTHHEFTRVVYRPGPQRRSGFSILYHELLDLYMPHIGGFQGVGYYAQLLRFVNRDSSHAFADRAFPTKRFLKQAGGIGADRLKQIELQLVAWGLIDIQIERITVRGRGGNQVTAVKYTYWVNDPLPEDQFHAAVRRGELPRPVPPELLPSWWSPDIAQRLGIPCSPSVAVPNREQGTGVAVPAQEQRPSFAVPAEEQRVAVPAQEQRNRCSCPGTQKQKAIVEKQKNVFVVVPSAHHEAAAATEPAAPSDDDFSDDDDDDDDRFARVLQQAYRAVVRKYRATGADAITITQARQLLAKYGFVACMRQLRTLSWRLKRGSLNSPLGYYLAALGGGYTPPKRRPSGRMAMLRHELQALKEQRQAEEQEQREEHLRQLLLKGEAVLSVLPPGERQALEQKAREALQDRFGGSDVPEPLVRVEMRLLALRRYCE